MLNAAVVGVRRRREAFIEKDSVVQRMGFSP